ncbi:putative signal transduction protein with Nacht domain protein [Gloeothece citriformis PCC 7424]|uniref:Putative signal transduction protein with Nacht domain protein n=1 Tax=Gloeothece citriformis (strain PCC 7424) TaxID=65393 RepID=B7KJJ5_GLOC7|nr:NACHT domain-containing protein [Gloeothece citriformis]ACK73672.1 putative signal transduction protein with Nacht domain protein [Gloeothece citriformis PCC 7424]
MNIEPEQVEKIDPQLCYILLHSQGDERLRVVMSLAEEKGETLTNQSLTPSQFPSRQAYREALIAQKKQQLAEGTVGQTIEDLKNLSLSVHGGTTSSVVVVEGTAEQILKSLNFSGVHSATLDQIIRVEPIPIDSKIVEYLTNLILEIIPGDKEKVFRASQKYVSNYYKNYGTLQVLGMRKPVSLDSIYTTVKLLSETDNLKYINIQNKDKISLFSRDGNNKKPGIKVANDQPYLMVLGAPGAGKSTFLRKIGLEAFKGQYGNYNHACIPVFLELKRFDKQKINLSNIISSIFQDCGFTNSGQLITKALKKGKILILLDGLDEVPSQTINQVISQIQEFIKAYKNNRFIISCRRAAYRSYFKDFQEVEIADFDHEQIKQFINNWFQSDLDLRAKTAHKCWAELEKNEKAKELAKTPLLLTFICLVYDEGQSLPKNRSILYKEALQILLKKWAAEKRLERDPIYGGFTTELEEILLAEIAFNGFKKDQFLFNKQELTQQIKTFLAENINPPQQLDGEAVLNAIAIQQGILVERAEDIYSFSHLTLQEYLTAQYIVNNNLIEELVIDHVTDVRWQEIFLLVAGLMQEKRGADRLLLLMEKQALNYLNTPTGKKRLIPLLRWAEDITTGSPADLKPVAKRAVALNFANAKAYAYALAKAYAKAYAKANAKANANLLAKAYAKANALAKTNAIVYFIYVANEMNKLPSIFQNVNLQELIHKLKQLAAKRPKENSSEQAQKRFFQTLIDTWLEAFHLTFEMINLSVEEVEEIDKKYSYIYWLMLQCQEAAARVTSKTWEGIEDRMFRVVEM